MTSEEVTAPSSAPPSKAPRAPRKPTRPDFDARDDKLKKLREKVDEYDKVAKAKAVEIDALVNEAKANNKLESLKRTLANTMHTRAQLEKLKANCQKRLEDARNPKAAVAKLSKGAGLNLTPDDILQQMERLREKVEVEQDPAERDRICARIQGLHSSWQALTGEKDATTARGAPAGKDLAATLEGELQKHTQDLKEVLAREQTERAAVEDLRAKIDESQPAIDRLRQEREVCMTVVRQLRDKMTEIRSDYSEQFETFKVAMAEWKTKMDEVMSERRAEREAENKAREEQRAARELETKGAPFSLELMRCDQLLLWCKKYEAPAEQAAAPAEAEPLQLDGMVPFKKKTDEESDDVFTTSRSKNKKKGGRACKKASTNGETGRINLDMETLSVLGKMRLPVPSTVADIPGLVEKVAAKKADYESKQKRKMEGETVAEDAEDDDGSEEDGAGPSNGAAGAANGSHAPVNVSMRCDEAFGQVILEIVAN
eukprot:jgi/Ulvmu1/10236/UM060_0037.1